MILLKINTINHTLFWKSVIKALKILFKNTQTNFFLKIILSKYSQWFACHFITFTKIILYTLTSIQAIFFKNILVTKKFFWFLDLRLLVMPINIKKKHFFMLHMSILAKVIFILHSIFGLLELFYILSWLERNLIMDWTLTKW